MKWLNDHGQLHPDGRAGSVFGRVTALARVTLVEQSYADRAEDSGDYEVRSRRRGGPLSRGGTAGRPATRRACAATGAGRDFLARIIHEGSE